MSDPKILEIRYSVRRDTALQEDPDNLSISVESAVLVAHVTYSHRESESSLSVDLGVVATKSTDPSSGLVVESSNKGLKLTLEEVKSTCLDSIKASIKSDENLAMYHNAISAALAEAHSNLTVNTRYSFSGINHFDH